MREFVEFVFDHFGYDETVTKHCLYVSCMQPHVHCAQLNLDRNNNNNQKIFMAPAYKVPKNSTPINLFIDTFGHTDWLHSSWNTRSCRFFMQYTFLAIRLSMSACVVLVSGPHSCAPILRVCVDVHLLGWCLRTDSETLHREHYLWERDALTVTDTHVVVVACCYCCWRACYERTAQFIQLESMYYQTHKFSSSPKNQRRVGSWQKFLNFKLPCIDFRVLDTFSHWTFGNSLWSRLLFASINKLFIVECISAIFTRDRPKIEIDE